MLKSHTELQSIVFSSPFSHAEVSHHEEAEGERQEHQEDVHSEFRQEIDFYTSKKLHANKEAKKYEKRQQECDPQSMFEGMLELLEKKSKQKKMPVRKFFNNTFGTILNDAIFALKKRQSKEGDKEELFTKKGQIKYVALYLLDNLPQCEREPDLYNSSDSNNEV